ncbi:MAG: cryptochrome/photolyase family protein [Pseudomonadota bacterium]
MTKALLILPHQLFADHPGLSEAPSKVVLFEDPLFFGDPAYPARLHKQKLWLHRASMAAYAERLSNHKVETVAYEPDAFLIDRTLAKLAKEGIEDVVLYDPCDTACLRRLRRAAEASQITLDILQSPGFLNTQEDNDAWSKDRKRWFMAEYYKYQRRRLNIMVEDGEPEGGKWSFDEDNRKKVPKAKLKDLPTLPPLTESEADMAAKASVLADFPDALGILDAKLYPTTHEEAEAWLEHFLHNRFHLFGDYEDAIVEGESWLWHSVLTPALNTGLLTPKQVTDAALDFGIKHDVPLNSLEGFIRQIIGWREFMRATYVDLGTKMRNSNHWNHTRPMPNSFYDGTTGIDPIDDVIKRTLQTGYCHHIERLMVLGGFMFLCEIKPDDIYRWFMEMFVDSYDWVMVPNVYAMSQHADGGLITTKPYFSGSNYVRKMSHWGAGDWAVTWDGLYWRFIWTHRKELGGNPRWAMMCRTVEKMDQAKLEGHLSAAKAFLEKL